MYTKQLIQNLKNNNMAILRTDTLYGIVGRAESSEVVERIYRLKERDSDKPFLILIDSASDIEKFGVELTSQQRDILEKYLPASITFILPISTEFQQKFSYLHRGRNSFAFRIPNKIMLRDLIAEVGPLVAPSANPQGVNPAQTISQARDYFDDKIDVYIDEGAVPTDTPASTIVDLTTKNPRVVREGSVKFVT